MREFIKKGHYFLLVLELTREIMNQTRISETLVKFPMSQQVWEKRGRESMRRLKHHKKKTSACKVGQQGFS